MEIDWIHQPGASSEGTLNLCFNALDRHVVHGRADETALAGPRPRTFARLLEEVAAFGGVLRAFGTGRGARVVSGLTGEDGLVAALASARVGATHVVDHGVPEVVVGDVRIARHAPEGGGLLDWDVLLRAGRTDPAPCEEVGPDAIAFVLAGREVSVLDALTGSDPSWPLPAVRILAGGGTVTMAP